MCTCGHEHYGYTIEYGFMRKTILPSHMLKVPPAICIQKEVIDAHRLEVSLIEVELDGQKIYSTSMARFCMLARTIERGAGKQYMLPLKFWNVKELR